MPSDDPYQLVIWRKVLSANELQHEDVVRIMGAEEDFRFSVRRRVENRNSHETLRLREIDGDFSHETGPNIFFDASVRFLAEQGLLLRRLYADVNEYDVWATQDQAWARRDGGWLPICSRYLGELVHEIPEGAALVWRHVPQEEKEGF